jgi:hypothetical protein
MERGTRVLCDWSVVNVAVLVEVSSADRAGLAWFRSSQLWVSVRLSVRVSEMVEP